MVLAIIIMAAAFVIGLAWGLIKIMIKGLFSLIVFLITTLIMFIWDKISNKKYEKMNERIRNMNI